MYWPRLVLPYQGSPSLWKTFVEVFTHTLPPPPPGACGIVDGSTGAALAFLAFASVLAVPSAFAGVAWARHSADVAASNSENASKTILSFAILKCSLLLWVDFSRRGRC